MTCPKERDWAILCDAFSVWHYASSAQSPVVMRCLYHLVCMMSATRCFSSTEHTSAGVLPRCSSTWEKPHREHHDIRETSIICPNLSATRSPSPACTCHSEFPRGLRRQICLHCMYHAIRDAIAHVLGRSSKVACSLGSSISAYGYSLPKQAFSCQGRLYRACRG
jgi:hypothetical protein